MNVYSIVKNEICLLTVNLNLNSPNVTFKTPIQIQLKCHIQSFQFKWKTQHPNVVAIRGEYILTDWSHPLEKVQCVVKKINKQIKKKIINGQPQCFQDKNLQFSLETLSSNMSVSLVSQLLWHSFSSLKPNNNNTNTNTNTNNYNDNDNDNKNLIVLD